MVKKAMLLLAMIIMIGISVFLFIQLSKPTPDEILQAEKEVYAFLLVELKLNAKKHLLTFGAS